MRKQAFASSRSFFTLEVKQVIFNIRPAQVLLLIVFSVLVGWLPSSVLAHEGGPQIMIDVGRIKAGESLEVRGANIGTDLVVTVGLVSNDTVVLLGEALCDGHGDFTQTFVLPKDLPSGPYKLQAVDTSVPGAEVVLASTSVSVRAAGWELFGINITTMAPMLAVLTVGLLVGWFMRKRSPSADTALAQQNIPA